MFNRLWWCLRLFAPCPRPRAPVSRTWLYPPGVKTVYSPHVFHSIFFQTIIVSQPQTIWCNYCTYYHEISPEFVRILHFSTITLLQFRHVWIYLEIWTFSYACTNSKWWKTQQNHLIITPQPDRTLVCCTLHTCLQRAARPSIQPTLCEPHNKPFLRATRGTPNTKNRQDIPVGNCYIRS